MQPQVQQAAPPTARRPWKRPVLILVALAIIPATAMAAIAFFAMRAAIAAYYQRSGSNAEAAAATTLAQKPASFAAAQPMETVESCAEVPSEESSALRQQQAGALIPLIPGMVMDTIWTLYDADLETLTRVTNIDNGKVNITLSGPQARAENGKAIVGPSKVIPVFPQCLADLATSHLLVTEGNPEISVPIRGVTRYSVSNQVYQQLKNGNPFPFEYRHSYEPVGAGYSWRYADPGQMQRDIPGSYRFKLILNGEQTDVPALHATGLLKDMPTQMTVLDDPANPLLLDFEIPKLRFALRMANITFPVANKIEGDLEKKGRAEVYGIYFDFDSAVIRAESESVLQEIAQALTANPAWQLTIQGHTDNIGGDAHNQALSSRRANAVKDALVEQYSISPGRFITAGFGASQPKAPNDTPEGRALNRRVELVKQP